MVAAKKPINQSTGNALTKRELEQMSHLRSRIAGLNGKLRDYFQAKYVVKETAAVIRAKAVLAEHAAKVSAADAYRRSGQDVTKVTNDLTTKVLFGDGLAALAAIEKWEREVAQS